MRECINEKATQNLPSWVPKEAKTYIAHTERGCSIRELARSEDCHPSTILRQVRKLEQRRDDPLIDDALRDLAGRTAAWVKETKAIPKDGLTQERIDQEAKRVLLRLCEPGAVMAVAKEMETAVIVREAPDGENMRTAVVEREIAQALALKDWIICPNPEGRVVRYTITTTGRSALQHLMAQSENAASGFRDAQSMMTNDKAWDLSAFESDVVGQSPRQVSMESPLIGLARRRDRDGGMFLMRDLVAVGERLREDFELAKMGGALAKDFGDFMRQTPRENIAKGASAAHLRVQAALQDLGPGLADVVFHCCCLLEGLEITEKAMGWSARSGKIVLRIALQRLKRHYAEQGKYAPMIG